MNKIKFKQKMIENNQTFLSLSDELRKRGITMSNITISQKVSGARDFKIREAVELANILNMNYEEFIQVFLEE